MDFLKKMTIGVIPALMLGGCYTEFDFDDKADPVVCLNAMITSGDTIRAQVTRTWAWSEGDPELSGENFVNIKDADVRLYVNGNFVEKMQPGIYARQSSPVWGEPIEGYVADYIPQSGDEIRIEVRDTAYGSAWGEVKVPYPVEIEAVDVKVIGFTETLQNTDYSSFDARYDMTLDMYARFTDPGATTDYYKLDASWMNYFVAPGEDVLLGTISPYASVDFSGEPLLTEHVSVLESLFSETSGYTVFSDRQISGKSYPLHVTIRNLSVSLRGPLDNPAYDELDVRVILSRVSDSYYRHVMSMWAANDGLSGVLGGVGLSEPVYAISNVSTGAGVVAAVAPYIYHINLRDLIEQQKELDRSVVM